MHDNTCWTTHRARRLLAGLAAALGIASPTLPCFAQNSGSLGATGAPIQTSDYSVDLFQGPLLSGARVTGLGGAFVAVADNLDGDTQNPATSAVRPTYSFDHFDYWLGLSAQGAGFFRQNDFFNNGQLTTEDGTPVNGDTSNLFFLTPSMNLQFGRLGIGLVMEAQSYQLNVNDATSPYALSQYLVSHAQLAYSFLRGELVMGAGMRFLYQRTIVRSDEFVSLDYEKLTSGFGAGLEVGAIWRPNYEQYRVGVSFRSPIQTNVNPTNASVEVDGNYVLQDGSQTFYLPRSAQLPGDLTLGFAYQFGKPFNPRWRSIDERLYVRHTRMRRESEARVRAWNAEIQSLAGDRLAGARIRALERAIADEEGHLEDTLEREETQLRLSLRARHRGTHRGYLLVSSSITMTTATPNAVGVESFLSQVVQRSGEHVVFTPRLGLETEPWQRHLKVRAGTYLEPTRFAESTPRVHLTGGFDIRTVRWDVFGLWPEDYVWQLTAAVDVARDFSVIGLSIGGWY
jgi:hypothetical protein